MMKDVSGKNKGKIVLYALSTCGWCQKTQNFLDKLGVEYSYVYVDLLDGEERESVTFDVK
jgi:glutaredoxin-like protein NrdH